MTEMTGQAAGPAQVPETATQGGPTNAMDEELRRSLATKDSLGAALTKQGRFDEAATLLKEVLSTRESHGQSISDTDMLPTLNNLAAALDHQGHLAEAEAMHRQVLAADEQSVGLEHAHTLVSMSNLASVLTRQGKLAEAHEMLERALGVSQTVRGPEMDETLGIMGNLGDNLLRQHRLEEAEGVCRETLTLRRKVLPALHPELATSMHNLAAVLRARGKGGEADALRDEEEAAVRQAKADPGAVQAAGRGGHHDAEDALRASMAAATEGDQQKRRDDMSRLGTMLIHNGKYEEAEEVLRGALVVVVGTA